MREHRAATQTQRDRDDRIGFGGFSLTVEQILSLTAEQLAKLTRQDRYPAHARQRTDAIDHAGANLRDTYLSI